MTVSLEKGGLQQRYNAPQRPRLFPFLCLPIFSGKLNVSQEARWLPLAQTRRNHLILVSLSAASQGSPAVHYLQWNFTWQFSGQSWPISESITGKDQSGTPLELEMGLWSPELCREALCPCRPWCVTKGKWSVNKEGNSNAHWSIVLYEWWGELEWRLALLFFGFYYFVIR